MQVDDDDRDDEGEEEEEAAAAAAADGNLGNDTAKQGQPAGKSVKMAAGHGGWQGGGGLISPPAALPTTAQATAYAPCW